MNSDVAGVQLSADARSLNANHILNAQSLLVNFTYLPQYAIKTRAREAWSPWGILPLLSAVRKAVTWPSPLFPRVS